MPALVLATTASANPMGAQRYDREIVGRAPELLAGWRVRHDQFRSLRSHLAGTRRAPMGFLGRSDAGVRSAAGRVLFPDRDAVVHRTDLILPPGRGVDVVTIHDTVAWRFPDESAPIRSAAAEARAAAAVVCVSAFTADEVSSFLGVADPIVIPNGVDERFFGATPLSAPEREALGLPGRYVLHTGGASERKNLRALAEAWPDVHREHPELTLALVGPQHPGRDSLFAGVAGTVLLGRLPDGMLPAVVAGASAVVIPSTYEGFGLPALEAMAAGVPVVAAASAALPEVVGDAGILVAPDGRGIRDGLLDVLAPSAEVGDLLERGRRRAARFTWDHCVAAHAEVWRSVA